MAPPRLAAAPQGRRPGLRPHGHPAPTVEAATPKGTPRRTQRLAKRPERGAELLGEDLRLLPGREVAAFVDLVVVDEIRIGPLGPAPRRLVQLARKDGHRGRDGD